MSAVKRELNSQKYKLAVKEVSKFMLGGSLTSPVKINIKSRNYCSVTSLVSKE